ncbi:PLP-dependent aminotransferase family protein [Pendulispora albinea]|uniref:PLP-dependent aminotransferase family protein n=1 Tax=Pendulispora albinea TaxID=2741071 RepID=A0ABZ2M6K7_9BACT
MGTVDRAPEVADVGAMAPVKSVAAGPPRREEVKRHVLALLESGALARGDRVPSIRELAGAVSAAKNTVIAALDELCGEGVLEPRERSGFFVREGKRAPRAKRAELRDLEADRLEHGLAVALLGADTGAFVNLGSGCLPARVAATEELKKLLRAPSRGPAVEYGFVDPQGDPRLRELVVAKRALGESRIDPEHVIITHGANEGLNLACMEAAGASGCRRIALESPGYFLLAPMLRHLSLEPVFVPRGPEGIDLDALVRERRRGGLAAFVTNPTHHNPLGTTLTLQERFALGSLAEREGMYLVEDDVFRGLSLERNEPATLRSLVPERTIYVSSFSKTLGASFRIGFLVAPRGLVRGVRNRKFLWNLGEEVRSQRLLADFLEQRGYVRHVEQVRAELARRAKLAAAQAKGFPDLGRLEPYRGGLFVRFLLRPGLRALALYESAKARRILISPGEFFQSDGRVAPPPRTRRSHPERGGGWMRISVGVCDGDVLRDSLRTLSELVTDR